MDYVKQMRDAEEFFAQLTPLKPKPSKKRGFAPGELTGVHPSPKEDPDWNETMVVKSVYGWRRDYGEYPTWTNLTDRVASEMFISHEEAQERIAFALNDVTSAVYACHRSDSKKLLAGERADPEPFGYTADKRDFYLDPKVLDKERDVWYQVSRNLPGARVGH
ncbi:MAG: hypothetical protein KY429_01545 [Actinobacteria bacterium]|nr:hypothetical protein [Actinomycetota bacterium]